MSESLSKESLLEYVKKQKFKIKKLEQELIEAKEKSAADSISATNQDLQGRNGDNSGGFSSLFWSPSATETSAGRNLQQSASEENFINALKSKDAELVSSSLRERKLKALVKSKIKEIEDKDKILLQYENHRGDENSVSTLQKVPLKNSQPSTESEAFIRQPQAEDGEERGETKIVELDEERTIVPRKVSVSTLDDNARLEDIIEDLRSQLLDSTKEAAAKDATWKKNQEEALSEIGVLKGEAIKRNGEAVILINKVQDIQNDLSSRDTENRGLLEDIETKMSLIADFENRLLREKTDHDKDLLAIKISNSALSESRSIEEKNAMDGLRSRVRELESNESSRDIASEKDSLEKGRIADALKSEVDSMAARLEEMKRRHQEETIELKMENSAIAEAARVEHEARLRDLRSDCDRDLSEAQEQQNSQVSKIKDDLCKKIENLGAQNKRLVESVSLLERRLMSESALSAEACSAADTGADEKASSGRKRGCVDPVSAPVLRSGGATDTESEVTTHTSSQTRQGLASTDGDVVAIAGITGNVAGTRSESKGGEVHLDGLDVTISALRKAAAASLLREETLQEKINYMDAEVSKMRLEVSNLQTKIQLQLEEVGTKNDALAALEVALSSSSSASDAFRAEIAEEEQQRREEQTRLEELLLSKDREAEHMKGLLESEQDRAEEYQKVIENLKLASQLAASETERLKNRLTELQEQPVVPLYDPNRDALDAAITESEETVRSLRAELKVASKELAAATSQLELAREEEAKLIIENKNSITDNKNREITLKERLSVIENRESMALRDMEDFRANIASLEEQLRTATIEAEEKLSSALQENKKAEAEVLRLLTAVKALENQLESSVAELSSSRTESVTEREEHQRVVLSQRDLTNRCSQLEKEKMALLREIGGASTKAVDSEREIDRLLAVIANSKSDLECLQHEMSSFKDAAAAEAEDLHRLLEDSKERLRDSERATLLVTGDSADKLAQVTKDIDLRAADYESEMSHCRIEREHLRKRVLELEGVIEGIERTASDDQQMEVVLAKVALERDEVSVLLDQQKSLVAEMTEKHTQAVCDLRAFKEDSEAKIEILSEKSKRLKTLLAKSKQMAQEREIEMTKITAMAGRPRRFGVQCRVQVPLQAIKGASGPPQRWCLIYEDHAPGQGLAQGQQESVKAGGPSNSLRWEIEEAVQAWEGEGSTMIGAWPESLQDQWSRDISELETKSKSETSELSRQLAEVTATFNSYKSRAQTALKRLGADDKGERVKELEERKRTEDLSEVIGELQTEVLTLSNSLNTEKDLVQSYLTKISAWEEAEASRLAESKAAADEVGELKSKLESQIASLQEEIAKSRFSGIERGSSDLGDADAAPSRPVVSANTSAITLRGKEKTEAAQIQALVKSDTDSTLHEDVGDAHPQILWEGDLERDEDNIAGTSTGTDTRGTRSLDRKEGAGGSGGSKLVLLHRAEDELRGNIMTLRSENSYLTREINDFRHRVALNDEQIASLKGSIRDLEMSLARQREFSGTSSEDNVNVEYLVHVLRKFLLTDIASERAKLVTVLCSILHLRGEDAKIIGEKWAVKAGGLVGWLMPRRPIQGSAVSMDDDYSFKAAVAAAAAGTAAAGTGAVTTDEVTGQAVVRADVSPSSLFL